jgi:hypothetical protein
LVRGWVCLQRLQGFLWWQLELGLVVGQLGFVVRELEFVIRQLGIIWQLESVVRRLGFVELDGCRLSPASVTRGLCASGAASEWRLDRRPGCTARSR